MSKIEEKNKSKNIKERENEQIRIEKEFHKTTFGKVMRFVLIMTMIALAIGLVIGIFEAIVNGRNLDISKYQTIIDLGTICFDYAGKSVFFCMLLYACVVPSLVKEKEAKEEKSKNKFSTIIVLTLFSLATITPMIAMVVEIFKLIF